MVVNVNSEIRRAVDTGKVIFGSREVEKLLLIDTGKVVIISDVLPRLEKERLENASKLAKVPFLRFEGSGIELGEVCGKPFRISAMIVKDTGKSKLLEAL